MKQKLFLVLVLVLSIKSFSQNSKFSIEASYPVPMGNNFLGKNYHGIIDIGAKYRFTELKVLNLGISLNSGYVKNSKGENFIFDVNVYLMQPRIFAEFNIAKLEKLHPQVILKLIK